MNLQTQRLLLEQLNNSHAPFIQQLTNTKGWLQNIGDRNTTTPEGLAAYMHKVLESGNPHYVIFIQSDFTPIGIISFMQRPNLDYPDVGFALLDNFIGQGFAAEACNAVLNLQITAKQLPTILAEVLPNNLPSITLLKKLGFLFQSELMEENELLHIYALDTKAFMAAQSFMQALLPKKNTDPLHGKTLEKIITELQEQLGWQALADRIPINCFIANPSIKSSLTFLRKTPWARKRVEDLWVARIGWQQ
jgi:[ribosomal protein S5]-alanine N-acetyltransferase